MIRDSNGGPDPVRTPMKPKASKHAPAYDAHEISCQCQRKRLKILQKGYISKSIPAPRWVFAVEVC